MISPTGETPPGSMASSTSVGEVLAALSAAASAQANAFHTSTGFEVMAAHQAHSDTIALRDQIVAKQGNNLGAMLDFTVYKVPQNIPA